MNQSPEDVFNQALTKYQSGQFQASAQLLNALLQANIASPDILNLMACSLAKLGRADDAEKLFAASIQINSNNVSTYLHKANVCREASRFDQAVECYQKIFELEPSLTQPILEAALIRQMQEKWDDAEVLLDRFLEEGGDKFEGSVRKAVCRYSLYDFEEAERLLEQSDALQPDTDLVNYYKAMLYEKTKRKDKALQMFIALINKGHEPSKFSLSLLYFSLGEWEKAFEFYDNRPVVHTLSQFCRSNGLTVWDGMSSFEGRHVFIYAEQGLGDQIRYMYFFEQLAKRAEKVSLIYDKRLYPIINSMFPSFNCIDSNRLDPELFLHDKPDTCLCVGSLGRVFGDDLNSRLGSEHLERGLARFISHNNGNSYFTKQQKSKPLIGISWRSIRPLKERSEWYCSAEEFSRLLSGIDAHFVCLQYAFTDQERDVFAQNGIKLIELEGLDLKDDQAALASVISQLDHVLSVSTALSELAGADGVNTTVFAVEDIRWFMSEKHIRGFYPNTRVFYKKMFSEWDDAIMQAREDLLLRYGSEEVHGS